MTISVIYIFELVHIGKHYEKRPALARSLVKCLCGDLSHTLPVVYLGKWILYGYCRKILIDLLESPFVEQIYHGYIHFTHYS